MIEAKNLSFRYAEGEGIALTDVNFKVEKGEVVFIVGNSGSGKSTLLNLINGIIPEILEGELSGELFVDQKKNLKIYEKSKILGNVFQNPRSQFFTTNTTAEFVFEMENFGFPVEEMKRRLEKIIREFQIEDLLDREIYSLSSGERQFLALLTALIMEPQVVIFDEPSANLDYGNAMRLKRQIRSLKEKGKTVIVSDHRCFYLQGLIDRVLLVENCTVKEFTSEQDFLTYDYGRRVFDLFSHSFETRRKSVPGKQGLCLEQVSFQNIIKDISFSLFEGEVTTLIGVNGVGKTTLAKLISGVLKPAKGKIMPDEQALYIMQDADFQLFGSACSKELEITCKDRKRNEEALKLLDLWRLRDHHPQTLSGGEKQRLQMAISLVSDNAVLLLDEPTSGLDKNSMKRVIEMIERLKVKRTIFIISHDYEFIRRCSDRILYMKEGRIEKDFYLEGNTDQLNEIFKEMEKNYE